MAAGIQNTAIQRLFAVGLNLQGAGADRRANRAWPRRVGCDGA